MSPQAHDFDTDIGPLIGSASVLTFEDVSTVIASGEFDAASGPGLAAALAVAHQAGGDVVVDMTGVTFLDGGSLREIERMGGQLARTGRSLRIAHPPRVVVRLLHALGALELLGP